MIPDLVYVARHARRFGWDVMQPLDLDPSNVSRVSRDGDVVSDMHVVDRHDVVYVARHARRFGWDVMQPIDLDPSNGVAARR